MVHKEEVCLWDKPLVHHHALRCQLSSCFNREIIQWNTLVVSLWKKKILDLRGENCV